MASPGQQCPVWRKPSEVMKLRQMKKRKRILDRRLDLPPSEGSNPKIRGNNEFTACHQNGEDGAPIVNPFKYTNHSVKRVKKVELSEESCSSSSLSTIPDESCDATLFQILCSSSSSDAYQKDSKQSSVIRNNIPNGVQLEDHFEATEIISNKEESGEWHPKLPLDWSLKTALRLTAFQPFPWSGRLTTPEEASGVTGFVRCLPFSGAAQRDCAVDTTPNAQLYQCLQVWMHPSLPWFDLFPRHANKRGHRSSAHVSMDLSVQKCLHSDWAESFRSLFQLVRARQCPYFYLCAQSFTALFRAAGIGGNHRIHAFLTPTSTGLRAALTEEGVEFSLPLKNQNEDGNDSEKELSDDDANDGDHCDSRGDDGDVVLWLNSVGVGKHVLADNDIDRSLLKKQKDIDYRPESLVYVEDGNVQALFNYLLNSKKCTATIGPNAGVPPTLLSPVAFVGGTLRPLKMRQHQALQDSKLIHILDVSGPLLPHTVQYLNRLLALRSPEGQSQMLLSTLEASISFSMYEGCDAPPTAFGQQSLSDCGLQPDVLQAMCSQLNGVVLRQIEIMGDKYRWS